MEITEGEQHAGVLQGEGTLYLFKGSLELASPLEPSVFGTFVIDGGVLTGTGSLHISHIFEWIGSSSVSGSSQLVIEKSATASIHGNLEDFHLAGRTLVNEGTLTLAGGSLWLSEGATVHNSGTFDVTTAKGIYCETCGTPGFVNSGTFTKTEGAAAVTIQPAFENSGIVKVSTGAFFFEGGGSSGAGTTWESSESGEFIFTSKSFAFSKASWKGLFELRSGGVVTEENVEASNVTVDIWSGSLADNAGTLNLNTLIVGGGTLTGPGIVHVSSTFLWENSSSTIAGSGSLVLGKGTSGNIKGNLEYFYLDKRALVNEGTLTLASGKMEMLKGALMINLGHFIITNPGGIYENPTGASTARIINEGLLERTTGTNTVVVEPLFENYGTISVLSGKIEFKHLVTMSAKTQYGEGNPSAAADTQSFCGKPVDCVTGNETVAQTDLSIGGRGVGLDLERTYNAQAAAKASSAGIFGYGWANSFGDHLVVESADHKATLYQANGSIVPFTEIGGVFTGPSWSDDTLTGSTEAGYTLTLANQRKYVFNGTSGRLESVEDRNGNKTTVAYNEKGQPSTITDPAGRKITLTYNAEGLVESAKDPMGHVVKYAYEGDNLTSVTLPGETSPAWRFKYDASHRMTAMIDGRGDETTNTYDSSNRVISQKDPIGHTLKFEYEPLETKITNEATGAVTVEQYNSSGLITAITHGYGTSSATTTEMTYNEADEPLSVTDGKGHTTSYEYDSADNRIRMVTPEGHETKWTYNSTHDVLSVARPNGEKTTVTRDERGNATVVSRPAPEEATQSTKYTYDSHGDLESMADPLGRTWKYEYDSYGDKTAEVDPEGDKRIWSYDEDSLQTATVSPRGDASGAEPAKFTTSTERDAQGRPVLVPGT